MRKRLQALVLAGVLLSACGEPDVIFTEAGPAPRELGQYDRLIEQPEFRAKPAVLLPPLPKPAPAAVHRPKPRSSRSGSQGRPSFTPGADLGLFTVTCYSPPEFPAGDTTASGAPVGHGSIAADWSVLPRGTKLVVDGYGSGMVVDTGGAIKGRKLDVWLPSLAECKRWGRKTVRVHIATGG